MVSEGELQAQRIADGPPVRATALFDGAEVRLRWAILDYELWRAATAQGVTVTRSTIEDATGRLDLHDRLASRVVLASALRPLPQGDWAGIAGQDSLAGAAEGILYDAAWNASPTETGTFASAVAENELRENRLLYAHAIADRSFFVAGHLALGLTDATAVAGNRYLYRIEVDGQEGNEGAASASTTLLVESTNALPSIREVTGKAAGRWVTLQWPVDSLEMAYGSYAIYRADAGAGPFEKVNTAPFLPADIEPEPGQPRYAFYRDSVPATGEFRYYVVGHSPFGLDGAASDTATVTVRPPRLRVQLLIDSVATTETSADLWWSSLDPAYADSLIALRLFRAERVEGPYEPAPSGNLASSVRAHTTVSPFPKSYYLLEGEDAHGHLYRSGPRLVQLEDNTPPAVPSGLTGADAGDGRIELQWTANTESDLAGYRLYRSADRNATFTEVSAASFPDPRFTDDTRDLVGSDSLYYQLLASDRRGNYSELTPILGVARADRTPPARPVLLEAVGHPEGIALTWAFSSTDDVVRHELQRRRTGSPDWTVLASIDNGERPDYRIENFGTDGAINYLDESDLPRREHQYQLIAFDESGNNAGSEMLTVWPYDDGSRAAVGDLTLAVACADSTLVSPLDAATQHRIDEFLLAYAADTVSEELLKSLATALLMNGLLTEEDLGSFDEFTVAEAYALVNQLLENGYRAETVYRDCSIHVDWSYPLDASVAQFRIYRSRDGSPLRLYRTLPVEFFFPGGPVPGGPQPLRFTDTEAVTAGLRYVYRVEAVHMDGGVSERGSGVWVLVE